MNMTRNLILAFALTLAAPTQLAFAQAAPPPELAQSVQRYAEAWGSEDAE
jgi:type IV secretory pathway VirB2 component (pilin)